MDFTAIDFETANSSRSSACALGLVQVRNGVVTAEYDWLIDPRQRFDGMNISIHGITPSMVKGKPTFAELWPTIEPLLQGEIVIAHNASFDMSVLRYCLDDSLFSYPDFKYMCTYLLGKKMLQELPSHKLNVVSEHFGIRLKHHDALDDARASALILLKLMEQWQQFDPLLLAGSQGYQAGTMYAGGYTAFKASPKKAAKKPAAPKTAAKTKIPVSPAVPDRGAPLVSTQRLTSSASLPAATPPVPGVLPVPELVRGQRVDIGGKLSASRILVSVEWDPALSAMEPDTSAFLLRETGRCEQDQDFVFYGNMEDPSSSVFYSKPAPNAGHLHLQLAKLPASITRIALTFTLYGEASGQNPGQINNASASLIDSQTGTRLAAFPFGLGLSLETAVVIGEFYRYKDKWRFVAIGEGFAGGLRALCNHYGLQVEPPEAAAAAKSTAESAATIETAEIVRTTGMISPSARKS